MNKIEWKCFHLKTAHFPTGLQSNCNIFHRMLSCPWSFYWTDSRGFFAGLHDFKPASNNLRLIVRVLTAPLCGSWAFILVLEDLSDLLAIWIIFLSIYWLVALGWPDFLLDPNSPMTLESVDLLIHNWTAHLDTLSFLLILLWLHPSLCSNIIWACLLFLPGMIKSEKWHTI